MSDPTRPLYSDRQRRTQGNSHLLIIFVLPRLTTVIAPCYLVDSTEWQRISALWHQDWVGMNLDEGLGSSGHEKQREPFAIILGALLFFAHYH
jgi:hypothetical protein